MKWSCAEIIHFLEIYQSYEVLWNIDLTLYHDRNARDENFKNLLNKMNEKGLNSDMDDVRKKIKTIKTVYSQELRKIEQSKKSGVSPDEIYKPKLSWFGVADNFLRSVTASRKAISNLDTMVPDLAIEEIQMEEIELNILDEPQETISRKRKRMVPPTKLNKKTKNSTSSLDRVEAAIQDLNIIAKHSSSVAEDDELDHFGKYVTASLRNLPSINAIRCQEKFHNILVKERLSALSETKSRASTPLVIESSNSSFSFSNATYPQPFSTTATNSSAFSSNDTGNDLIEIAFSKAFDSE